MKKKAIITLIAVITVIIAFATAFIIFMYGEKDTSDKKTIRIGVSLYRSNDTFISSIKKEMENYVKYYEKRNKIKLNMEIVDAGGSQSTQNKQVDRFISLDYDVICINPVERANASVIIDKAIAADIPVVFFNREPVEDDMKRSSKFCYVGADPKESAVLEGQILVDAYKKDKRTLDLNGDGEVSYILLEGEASHQDSIVRTEWSIKTLKSGGVPIKKLAGDIANWERSQAAALMEGWVKKYGNKIELILSNNDDMALGAIDIIKNEKSLKDVKVVGVDATEPALEAIKKGELFGSVSSDKPEYARAIIELAIAKATGNELPEDIKEKCPDGKYYKVSQYIVTTESLSKITH